MFDNNNMNNYSNINNQNGDSKKMILPIVIIVVVIIIGIGMGVGIFFLVGPGKETAEMKLCKNVNFLKYFLVDSSVIFFHSFYTFFSSDLF